MPRPLVYPWNILSSLIQTLMLILDGTCTVHLVDRQFCASVHGSIDHAKLGPFHAEIHSPLMNGLSACKSHLSVFTISDWTKPLIWLLHANDLFRERGGGGSVLPAFVRKDAVDMRRPDSVRAMFSVHSCTRRHV